MIFKTSFSCRFTMLPTRSSLGPLSESISLDVVLETVGSKWTKNKREKIGVTLRCLRLKSHRERRKCIWETADGPPWRKPTIIYVWFEEGRKYFLPPLSASKNRGRKICWQKGGKMSLQICSPVYIVRPTRNGQFSLFKKTINLLTVAVETPSDVMIQPSPISVFKHLKPTGGQL